MEINIDFFNKIDSKEKAYWLGMLYADGNVYKRSENWFNTQLGVNKKDRMIIDRFANAIGAKRE